jgi:hypothetical protein
MARINLHHDASSVNHPLYVALELAESFGDGCPDFDDYGALPSGMRPVRHW